MMTRGRFRSSLTFIRGLLRRFIRSAVGVVLLVAGIFWVLLLEYQHVNAPPRGPESGPCRLGFSVSPAAQAAQNAVVVAASTAEACGTQPWCDDLHAAPSTLSRRAVATNLATIFDVLAEVQMQRQLPRTMRGIDVAALLDDVLFEVGIHGFVDAAGARYGKTAEVLAAAEHEVVAELESNAQPPARLATVRLSRATVELLVDRAVCAWIARRLDDDPLESTPPPGVHRCRTTASASDR